MASPSSPSPSRRVAANNEFWLRGRAALLLLLLATEIAAVSLLYDFQPLQRNNAFLARVFGYGTPIFRVLAMAFIALLVIGRRRIPDVFRRWSQLASHDRTFAWAIIGHVVAAACFALLSPQVLQRGVDPIPVGRLGLWSLSGGLALVFWLFALAPVQFWSELWQSRNDLVLATCLLIGCVVHFVSHWASALWYPLSDLTFAVTKWLLGLVSNDIVSDPEVYLLGTDAFQIQIAPVCSGHEGIGLVAAALALFLVLFRRRLRFPQALLLLPIGIVAIWICNALRITALILVGTYLSRDVALGGFHSQAGWIAFSAVTIAIGAVALRSRVFAKIDAEEQGAKDVAAEPATAAYLLPLLVLVAAAMVTTALSSGFDALYPAKILVATTVLTCFLSVYRSIPWSWSWLAALNGVVVYAIWLSLEGLATSDGTQLSNALQELSPLWRNVWLGFRVAGSVLVVPLIEELAFRGYLMRRLTSAEFDSISYRQASWMAVFVSSVLFGLLHGRWFAGTLAGLCYAMAARRRDMLCDAIVAHCVTNGMIAVHVLVTGTWQLWT